VSRAAAPPPPVAVLSGRVATLAAGALALATGAAAGAFSLAEDRWLNVAFEPSPQLLVAAPLAVVLLVAMTRRPEIGLHALLVIAYTNLSEVLVRQGLPSVLQLLLPLLLLVLTWAAVRELGRGVFVAPPPELVLFALAAALYVAWAWLSAAWATEPDRSLAALVELAKAAVLGGVVAVIAGRAARLRHAAWALLAAGAVLAALSSWQVLTDGWAQSFFGLARVKLAHIAGTTFAPRATGPLADPNFYAQMLLPLVPIGIALALSRTALPLRLLAAGLAAVVGLGIVTTYSRGGALSLGAALALFGFLERQRVGPRQALMALALGIALLAALPDSFWNRLGTLEVLLPGQEEGLQSHDSSVDKRKLVMGAAALMALDHPVAGVGLGNYTTHFQSEADRIGAEGRVYHLVGEQAYAHSLYLEILAELGLVGLGLFALVVGLALVLAGRARRDFLAAGDPDGALLARALAIGVVGMLVSSTILHGDYPRYLWLAAGLCAASAGAGARRRAEAAR